MTQYSYQELREALDKASDVRRGISIGIGVRFDSWDYAELDDLQAILDYLPEKPTAEQKGDKIRSDAWRSVLGHPLFEEARWGNKPILEAVVEKLDELHRGPLPTEYGSMIKNVKVVIPHTSTREYDYMQLTNVGWFGVDKDTGILRHEQPKHITSWEPFDSE